MSKKLILHDLCADECNTATFSFAAEDTVFAANPIIETCVGCYGCWIKTPGHCVIDDRGKGFAALISKHDEFIVISRLVFGGFSPSIKAALDRSIGHILPFFRFIEGEMHHDKRSKNKFSLRYIFYGDNMKENDKATARKLIAANALNFAAEKHVIEFYPTASAIEVTG